LAAPIRPSYSGHLHHLLLGHSIEPDFFVPRQITLNSALPITAIPMSQSRSFRQPPLRRSTTSGIPPIVAAPSSGIQLSPIPLLPSVCCQLLFRHPIGPATSSGIRNRPFSQPPLLTVLFVRRSFLFFSLCLPSFCIPLLSFYDWFPFCFSDFPVFPLGVGVSFLHCMTSALFHSREYRSIP
jgi:hypothetical protein